MSKIKFVNLGEKDPNSLNFMYPILYRSGSLISSMSYSGPSTKILESTAFTDGFKEKLVSIKGQVSLGSTGSELRNVHVYSRNAERLDGIERICYLQQEDGQLLISEYSGNRGAKYSALYKILSRELCNVGFNNTQNKFIIGEAEIPKFVKLLNEIIDRRESGVYELVPLNKVDSLIIDKQRYYYHMAYWQPITSTDVTVFDNSKDDSLGNIDQAFRVLVDHSRYSHNKDELIKLSEKITKLGKSIEARIRNLGEFEELSSDL